MCVKNTENERKRVHSRRPTATKMNYVWIFVCENDRKCIIQRNWRIYHSPKRLNGHAMKWMDKKVWRNQRTVFYSNSRENFTTRKFSSFRMHVIDNEQWRSSEEEKHIYTQQITRGHTLPTGIFNKPVDIQDIFVKLSKSKFI